MNGNLVDESGLVLDAFAGHFENKVKTFTEPNDKLSWIMMDGGINPKAQPLDGLTTKSGRDSTGTCLRNGHCVVP